MEFAFKIIKCFEVDFDIFVNFNNQNLFTLSKPEVRETCRKKKKLMN